ncbi:MULTISPECIES: hypothetical protein [Stenotrophomonas]|uniref:hypothetical protein n=1 Tax=Stenotrophomonas TaxID=40323 RepID=UPI0018D36B9E|nr:hypothetical protein [Stenotrophomonas sp.]MBH1507400.1 hypothetical protein [Stenotrophomonas maltophilia]
MKVYLKVLTIVAFSFATGFFVSRSMQQRDSLVEEKKGEDSYAPTSASLSDSQISDLESLAEKGDIPAMRQLYIYHEFVSGHEIEAHRWQRRMADAGDSESQAAILSRLALSSKEGGSSREILLGVCMRWYKD